MDFTWQDIGVFFLHNQKGGFPLIINTLIIRYRLDHLGHPGSPPNTGDASIVSEQKVVDVHFSEPAVEYTSRESLPVSLILQHIVDKKRENFPQKSLLEDSQSKWEHECIMKGTKSLM